MPSLFILEYLWYCFWTDGIDLELREKLMLESIIPFSSLVVAGLQTRLFGDCYCRLKITEYQSDSSNTSDLKRLCTLTTAAVESNMNTKRSRRRKRKAMDVAAPVKSETKKLRLDEQGKHVKTIISFLSDRPALAKLYSFWKSHGLVKNPFYPDLHFSSLHLQVISYF